jgi:hypothetical protein
VLGQSIESEAIFRARNVSECIFSFVVGTAQHALADADALADAACSVMRIQHRCNALANATCMNNQIEAESFFRARNVSECIFSFVVGTAQHALADADALANAACMDNRSNLNHFSEHET